MPSGSIPLIAILCEFEFLALMSTAILRAFGALLLVTSASGEEMSPYLRGRVLLGHNMRRSYFARGIVEQPAPICRSLPPAVKMNALVYDCDLERSAQQWSAKCQWKHSHKKGVGENLFVIWTSAPRPVPIEKVVEQAMHDWWEGEYKKLPFPFPKNLAQRFFDKSGAGHLTQMSSDLISRVGCAATVCPKLGHFFVCQYDAIQLEDRPMYETGEMCSSCGRCDEGTGLCVTKNRRKQRQCRVQISQSHGRTAPQISHRSCKGKHRVGGSRDGKPQAKNGKKKDFGGDRKNGTRRGKKWRGSLELAIGQMKRDLGKDAKKWEGEVKKRFKGKRRVGA